MSHIPDPDGPALANLGFQVSRATANLPQTTSEALFTITGGRVLVSMLLGLVTTTIQAQANNTKLVFNPDGAGLQTTDISAVLDITSDPAGIAYAMPATSGNAMSFSHGRILQNNIPSTPGAIFAEGTINLNCAASNTGQVAWDIWYMALDQGATIVAA